MHSELERDRIAEQLEDKVNPSKQYDSVLWEHARKNKLRKMFLNGQTTLEIHITEINTIVLENDIPEFTQNHTTQLNLRGEKMETHESLDVDTMDVPEGETLKGEVTEINKGAREEFFDPDENGEYEFGEASDEFVEIVAEVDYKGSKVPVRDRMRYYDNPHPSSSLGAFIRRYGKPEVGAEVTVDFDKKGHGQIVKPN